MGPRFWCMQPFGKWLKSIFSAGGCAGTLGMALESVGSETLHFDNASEFVL